MPEGESCREDVAVGRIEIRGPPVAVVPVDRRAHVVTRAVDGDRRVVRGVRVLLASADPVAGLAVHRERREAPLAEAVEVGGGVRLKQERFRVEA
jgi:hypothetical protein